MAFPLQPHAVLSVAEMSRADSAAIAGGVPGERLMEAAGGAVADEVRRRFDRQPVVVLCGPGNNGGDGFVAARHLATAGWPVSLALLGRREALKGDAAVHAVRWSGPVEEPSSRTLDGAGLVIDALFGAGLTRPLDGVARELVETVNSRRMPCVAVDVPSGVHGDTGQALDDCAPRCVATVTFFRKKPAHLLLPGRLLCGEVNVADIGIADAVLEAIAPTTAENDPDLWRGYFPWPSPGGHKYTRGHAVVLGGGRMTGAGRLAARAALRAGAGLVTVAAPEASLPVYATAAAGAILAAVDDDRAFSSLIADPRVNVALLGPGTGVSASTRMRTIAALTAGKACVLDADALSAFADEPDHLCRAVRRQGPGGGGTRVLLTPHEGELARLFADIARGHAGDKLARARAAAARSGAVVLLKGFDTVIAAPDGRTAINGNAPPDLATAGAGDVLAGIAAGLMARGMGTFAAGCAAAWLHGEAAAQFGPGLIADDIIEMLPSALRKLQASCGFTR